jgi:hypothetical protein
MRTHLSLRHVAANVVSLAFGGVLLSSCAQIIGISDYVDGQCAGGVDTKSCYTGPEGTEGKGQCKSGHYRCLADNTWSTACEGEVLPDATDDCSGRICKAGETKTCYGGPAGTSGVGICRPGTQTCATDGLSFDPCVGDVQPDATNQNGGLCSKTAWSEVLGDAATFVTGLAVDSSGNSTVVGVFSSSLTFGTLPPLVPTSTDCFMAKFDPAGVALAAQRFGGATGGAYAPYVALASDGGVVVGGDFSGSINFGGGSVQAQGANDLFLVKYDASGAYAWSKTFGAVNATIHVTDMALDQTGSIVVTGSVGGTVAIGGTTYSHAAGQGGGMLAKFDKDGTPTWGRDNVGFAKMAVDSSGNIIGAIDFTGTIDFGKGPLVATGAHALAVAKLDGSGVCVWNNAYNVDDNVKAYAAAVDKAGNIFIGGAYFAPIDFGTGKLPVDPNGVFSSYLVQFDTQGKVAWNKGFVNSTIIGLSTDAAGKIFVHAGMYGDVDFGGGALQGDPAGAARTVTVLEYDTSGKYLWGKSFGPTTGSGHVHGDPTTTSLVIAGSTTATIDFHTGTLKGPGMYLAKVPTTP